MVASIWAKLSDFVSIHTFAVIFIETIDMIQQIQQFKLFTFSSESAVAHWIYIGWGQLPLSQKSKV